MSHAITIANFWHISWTNANWLFLTAREDFTPKLQAWWEKVASVAVLRVLHGISWMLFSSPLSCAKRLSAHCIASIRCCSSTCWKWIRAASFAAWTFWSSSLDGVTSIQTPEILGKNRNITTMTRPHTCKKQKRNEIQIKMVPICLCLKCSSLFFFLQLLQLC